MIFSLIYFERRIPLIYQILSRSLDLLSVQYIWNLIERGFLPCGNFNDIVRHLQTTWYKMTPPGDFIGLCQIARKLASRSEVNQFLVMFLILWWINYRISYSHVFKLQLFIFLCMFIVYFFFNWTRASWWVDFRVLEYSD